MSTTELAFRVVCAILGTSVILAVLVVEVRLGDDSLDWPPWVICGIISLLLIGTAVVGPDAAARFLIRG